jgi:ribosomal protein S18 acetylase RimI-like enzyme
MIDEHIAGSDELELHYLSKKEQHSDYDWININLNGKRVGKIRCIINRKKLTICSINIFPEFERKGYAKKIIDLFKKQYNLIIADKVRHEAIKFWEKMGFTDPGDRNFIFKKTRKND